MSCDDVTVQVKIYGEKLNGPMKKEDRALFMIVCLHPTSYKTPAYIEVLILCNDSTRRIFFSVPIRTALGLQLSRMPSVASLG